MKLANESAVQVNELVYRQTAQHSTGELHTISTHSGPFQLSSEIAIRLYYIIIKRPKFPLVYFSQSPTIVEVNELVDHQTA